MGIAASSTLDRKSNTTPEVRRIPQYRKGKTSKITIVRKKTGSHSFKFPNGFDPRNSPNENKTIAVTDEASKSRLCNNIPGTFILKIEISNPIITANNSGFFTRLNTIFFELILSPPMDSIRITPKVNSQNR